MVINTPAFYDTELITSVKCFIAQVVFCLVRLVENLKKSFKGRLEVSLRNNGLVRKILPS